MQFEDIITLPSTEPTLPCSFFSISISASSSGLSCSNIQGVILDCSLSILTIKKTSVKSEATYPFLFRCSGPCLLYFTHSFMQQLLITFATISPLSSIFHPFAKASVWSSVACPPCIFLVHFLEALPHPQDDGIWCSSQCQHCPFYSHISPSP